MNQASGGFGLQTVDLGPVVFSAAPADPRHWQARGIALCRRGNFREGVEALRRAVQLAPQSAEMRNNLALQRYSFFRPDASRERLAA